MSGQLAPLTLEALHFLASGVRPPDPRAERIPDGPVHYRVVHELLDRGFSHRGYGCLEVTDAGRIYFEAGGRPLPPLPHPSEP